MMCAMHCRSWSTARTLMRTLEQGASIYRLLTCGPAASPDG